MPGEEGRLSVDELTRAEMGIALQREFFVRAKRLLLAYNGFDVEQVGRQSLSLRLRQSLGFEITIGDANRPPFRANGRSVRRQLSLAPAGGNSSVWLFGVDVPKSGQGFYYAALVIEALHYKGAADLTYGITSEAGLTPAAGNILVRDVEALPSGKQPSGAFPQFPARVNAPMLFDASGAQVAVGGAALYDVGFIAATAAAGPGFSETLGDIVIFPGEIFVAQMDVVATAGRLGFRGTLWDFGQAPGSGELPK